MQNNNSIQVLRQRSAPAIYPDQVKKKVSDLQAMIGLKQFQMM